MCDPVLQSTAGMIAPLCPLLLVAGRLASTPACEYRPSNLPPGREKPAPLLKTNKQHSPEEERRRAAASNAWSSSLSESALQGLSCTQGTDRSCG